LLQLRWDSPMPLPFDPNWKPDTAEQGPAGSDLDSLRSAPDFMAMAEAKFVPEATDFHSLRKGFAQPVAAAVPRTWTDTLIDCLIPLLLLVMVYSVISFLLDVRYVYTAVHDQNLRIVAFFFVLGVVALNRLIVRDGSEESFLYFFGLAGAIALYTLATTQGYEVGSISRNFLNDAPWIAVAFNMTIVCFIWWLVNRLTHECCVDENRHAGDIGILTGTLRGFSAVRSVARAAPAAKVAAAPKPKVKPKKGLLYEDIVPMMELTPVDPAAPRPAPEAADASAAKLAAQSAAARLPKRHPGVSIFYFSVPVMAIFALGLRVVQHGGAEWVRAGMLYLGVYTFTALTLLMLTSLAGLREYFRARRVPMPGALGFFWIGLGLLMVAMVMLSALALPLPALPPMAVVDEHQRDAWNRGDTFEIQEVALDPVEALRQEVFVERLSRGVLFVIAATLLYALLRGFATMASRMLLRKDRYPRWLLRCVGAADRAISVLTRLPPPRERRPRVRVDRNIARSAHFSNSMAEPTLSARMTPADHIAHAYAALCALAEDLGAPRQEGQTPFEFIAAFPPALASLREEAEDLTRLYTMSAYGGVTFDEKTLDRVRRFWTVYGRLRNRIVR